MILKLDLGIIWWQNRHLLCKLDLLESILCKRWRRWSWGPAGKMWRGKSWQLRERSIAVDFGNANSLQSGAGLFVRRSSGKKVLPNSNCQRKFWLLNLTFVTDNVYKVLWNSQCECFQLGNHEIHWWDILAAGRCLVCVYWGFPQLESCIKLPVVSTSVLCNCVYAWITWRLVGQIIIWGHVSYHSNLWLIQCTLFLLLLENPKMENLKGLNMAMTLIQWQRDLVDFCYKSDFTAMALPPG